MPSSDVLTTELTRLLGIQHPVILAGMNVAAGPELAAAVTNAGGLGVIGGLGYTPEFMRSQIREIKKNLVDKNAPFGVDLALPQVGGNARKTNYDYTHGHLPELIDIIIEEKTKLFVSAVGIPPRWAVDKLHAAGILVMNVIGSPNHVKKCLDGGIDILCCQGGEGGGHTGDLAGSILIPVVVDMVKGKKSDMTKGPIHVVAAGGIFDGRGLATALIQGAQAVWVGTRFICADEAGAPDRHRQAVINAGFHDTTRTLIYSGRPLRLLKTKYVNDWESRPDEIKRLTEDGKIPFMHEMESRKGELDAEEMTELFPLLMGQVAGAIKDIKPAKQIVEEMVEGAVVALREANGRVVPRSKL